LPNQHAALGCIRSSTQNTTHFNASLIFHSGRRAPIDLHGLGDSQTHVSLLADWIFGGYDNARIWHF
jgi:hypothetical protein